MYTNTLKSVVNNSVQAGQAVVPRHYPLFFKMGTNAADVAAAINTWNEYFEREIAGEGYFHPAAHFENVEGEVVEAYYLHSDLVFWNDFLSRHASLAPHIEAVVMEGGVDLVASTA